MKYYTLTISTDTQEIGFYPQVERDTKPLYWLLPPFYDNYSIDKFLDLTEYFDIIINIKAKLTDFIGCNSISWGQIISEHTSRLFKSAKLPPHKFYPINVFYQEVNHQYYWLHNYENMFEYIDMKKSEFSIQKDGKEIIYSFNSEAFYKEKKVECLWDFEATFKIKKIRFLTTFPKYDFFEFESFTFISENLLNELKKNNITGFEFSELDYEVKIEK